MGWDRAPGPIATIEADPRGALLAELDRSRSREVSAPSLPSSAQGFRTVADAERQARRIVAARARKEGARDGGPPKPA